jgi:hypothetical protein
VPHFLRMAFVGGSLLLSTGAAETPTTNRADANHYDEVTHQGRLSGVRARDTCKKLPSGTDGGSAPPTQAPDRQRCRIGRCRATHRSTRAAWKCSLFPLSATQPRKMHPHVVQMFRGHVGAVGLRIPAIVINHSGGS